MYLVAGAADSDGEEQLVWVSPHDQAAYVWVRALGRFVEDPQVTIDYAWDRQLRYQLITAAEAAHHLRRASSSRLSSEALSWWAGRATMRSSEVALMAAAAGRETMEMWNESAKGGSHDVPGSKSPQREAAVAGNR